MFQLLMQMDCKMSEFKFYLSITLSDMISCNGWPDSSQEHYTSIPHCMNTITYWDAWQLLLGTSGYGLM